MNQQKEYYAFISYKREDEKWAKWLQGKLEHYRFPTNLNGRTDLPKNIRPTFRDVTDLKPGLLAEEINNALRNSEWLIVVCSPRSAKSPWVCKEAQTFIDLGREDHIIPFVIEGNPFSSDTATECYPEALLNLTGSKELLAANINEMGRDAAAIKVVARMFNFRFDTLWQRYEREQNLKRYKRFAIILGIVTVLALASILFSVIVSKERDIANDAKIRAEKERLKVETAYKKLEKANDSIREQNFVISEQRSILDKRNSQLKEERDNVIKKNREILIVRSKYVAQIANRLSMSGDSYLARLLLLEVLPSKEHPNIPYSKDAEIALRRSFENNTTLLRGHKGEISWASFSSSGLFVVSASYDKTVRIWDVNSSACIKTLIGHEGQVNSAKFSQDGRLVVSASSDGTARIWDVNSGKCVQILRSEYHFLFHASFSPDNHYVVACDRRRVYIWNALTGQLIKTLEGHTDFVHYVVFSHDGNQVVSVSEDRTVRVWNVKTGKCNRIFKESQPVFMANFAVDDLSIYLLCNGDSIFKIDLASAARTVSKELGKKDVLTEFINPNRNQELLFSSDSKVVEIRDLAEYTSVELDLAPKSVNSISFSKDGKCFVSGTKRKSIIVGNVASGEVLNKLTGIDIEMKLIASSSNGRIVAASDGKALNIWNIAEKKLIKQQRFGSHKELITNHDGTIVAMRTSFGLVLYDVYSGNISLVRPKFSGSLITSLAFSPNGKYIVSGESYGNICIRNSKSCEIVKSWAARNCNFVKSVAYSMDSQSIVSTNGKTIYLWNTSTGKSKELITLKGTSVANVMFSHDGLYIAAISDDGKIYILNTETNESPKILYNGGEILSAAFSEDNSHFYCLTRETWKGNYVMRKWSLESILPITVLIDKATYQFKNRLLTTDEQTLFETK